MNHILKKLGAAAAFALFGAAGALAGSPSSASMSVGSSPSDISSAESGSRALLDTLVKKGVITDQEAEEIGVKMTEDEVTSPNVKFEQSLGIKKLLFYGDMRFRYENRSGQVGAPGFAGTTAVSHNDTEDKDRFRYRLRFGFKADLVDDWFGGFRLATNPFNQRSGNVTYGDGESSGPFGKSKSLVAIDQVYLGWRGTDWLTLEIGRMPNMLYTSNMVWDPNINIDGISEQLHHQFGDKLLVFGNFVQAMYADSGNDNTANGTQNFNDVYMFAEQIGAQYNFTKDINAKIAPTLYTYSGTRTAASNANSGSPFAGISQPSGFAGPFNGDGPIDPTFAAAGSNTYAINNLFIFELPGEVNFKIGTMPMKVFADFADNLDADTRAKLAGHPGRGGDDGYAWQAGVQVNNAKKKGDWQTRLYWQRTGTYALDPNLVDADIFDGRTNMQGAVINATYNFTDAISATVQYANAGRIDDSPVTAATPTGSAVGTPMGTPGTGQDLNINSISRYQLVQFDLNWKF